MRKHGDGANRLPREDWIGEQHRPEPKGCHGCARAL